MSILKLYLLLIVVPNLSGVFLIICVVLIGLTGLIICNLKIAADELEDLENRKRDFYSRASMAPSVEIEEKIKEVEKKFCRGSIGTYFTIIFAILFFIMGLLVPSKKDILQVYGLHYATNVKGLSELPNNALDFLNSELKKQIKVLKNGNN